MKTNYYFFSFVGGGDKGWFFLTKNPDLKKNWRGWGEGGLVNVSEQMFQMALLLLKENNYAKLLWNPCINVEVMARTSSIFYHFIQFWPVFIIWPSSVIMTFNRPKQMFQMALLLLKENTSAKLFWNPCINVGVIAWKNLDGCTQAHTP